MILRIPCSQPYSYIEEVYEGDNPKARFDELYSLMNGGQAVSELAFNEYLIALANSDLTKWGHIEDYNKLTPKQQEVCQAYKRFLKRLKAANQE